MLEKCSASPQPRGAFVSCARDGRSISVAPCSSVIGFKFCSVPLCFVHVMHGLTLVYTDKTTLKCDKEFDGKGVGLKGRRRREEEKMVD